MDAPPPIDCSMADLNKCVRLLLVEDDATFAKAIGAALSRTANFDIECCEVRELGEAVSLIFRTTLDREVSRFDVILLDLNLPDSEGLDTFTQMRSNCLGVPIIVLTGSDDEELAMKALKHGAQDYLVKGDIDGRTLARSIQYAIERGRIMAEREDFVATLTHDLKGPLLGANRILGLLIKGDLGSLTGDQTDLLSRLSESNDTLLEMISNLLEVYRYEKDIHTIAFAHTNLVNLVNSCMNEVTHLARERSIEIRRVVANGDDISIMADASSISRVVRNLLDNALKFTPKGGTVTVRVSKHEQRVRLAVEDTGPGIPEEDRTYLFERFYRGSMGRSYSRSTGLGLYLCRQIVQLHNGTITCDPKGSNGSVFVLEFPPA